ncbi:hypothetical protein TNCV_3663591 [Trichonephila clavipes]|nr:hypothetical protein TNCV_3663591 [Trichonephila clavipes]
MKRLLSCCLLYRRTGPALGIIVWDGNEFHFRIPLVHIVPGQCVATNGMHYSRLPLCVVGKFAELGTGSGVVLMTLPRIKFTKSVVNSRSEANKKIN